MQFAAYQTLVFERRGRVLQITLNRPERLNDAAWMANERQRCGVETSMAKLFATEIAKSVALECQTIFGAYGYVKNFDVERYVRDALLLPIIGGSSAVQRNNIFKWSGAMS